MGVLLVPMLIIIALAPTPQPSDAALADFSRFSKALGQNVTLVDREGTVREGLVSSSTADSVTLAFGAGERIFARADVIKAERSRDGVKDGIIKGALFGGIVGVFAAQGYRSQNEAIAGWFGSVAIYSGIGWAMDASQKHPETIYRNASAPAAAVKLAVRF